MFVGGNEGSEMRLGVTGVDLLDDSISTLAFLFLWPESLSESFPRRLSLDFGLDVEFEGDSFPSGSTNKYQNSMLKLWNA